MERTAEIQEWNPIWNMSGYWCFNCGQNTGQNPCIRITDNYNERRYVSSFMCLNCANDCNDALNICGDRKI